MNNNISNLKFNKKRVEKTIEELKRYGEESPFIVYTDIDIEYENWDKNTSESPSANITLPLIKPYADQKIHDAKITCYGGRIGFFWNCKKGEKTLWSNLDEHSPEKVMYVDRDLRNVETLEYLDFYKNLKEEVIEIVGKNPLPSSFNPSN